MSIFVIGDLHLNGGKTKPMDVFGGWHDHYNRLQAGWNSVVTDDDTTFIIGDTSWAMNLDDFVVDKKFFASLRGKKILMRGNHDYWWTTLNKMRNYFDENKVLNVDFLQNNAFEFEDKIICGTRGWVNDTTDPQNKKIVMRECERLKLSLNAIKNTEKEKIVMFHYPPIFKNSYSQEFVNILQEYSVKHVYYGHIHGANIVHAFSGRSMGIEYSLVSADSVDFTPVKLT